MARKGLGGSSCLGERARGVGKGFASFAGCSGVQLRARGRG